MTGFAFGFGGLGAAALGQLADATSINLVFTVCSFLPAIGLLTWFLPNIEPKKSPIITGKPTIKNIPSQSRLISRKSFIAMLSTVRINPR